MADAHGAINNGCTSGANLMVRTSASPERGSEDIKAVPGTGGLVVFSDEYHRMKAFMDLRGEVPRDQCDLPRFLYRIDLLPYEALVQSDAMSPEERQNYLRSATIDMNYREGFPALPDGGAIWGQWAFEDNQLHQAFVEYLELRDTTGIRSIRDLHSLGEFSSKLTLSSLWEAFTYYYWDDRAQAYDLFQAVTMKKMRERRILQSTNQRYLESERLLTMLNREYFEKIDPDTQLPVWIDELNPAVAIKMYETLNKVQRESLGMHSGNSAQAPTDDIPATRSGIVGSMQQIAAKGKPEQDRSAPAHDVLEMLRSDGDIAEKAQDLVIQLNEHRKTKDAARGQPNSGGMGFTGGASDGIDETHMEEKLKAQRERDLPENVVSETNSHNPSGNDRK